MSVKLFKRLLERCLFFPVFLGKLTLISGNLSGYPVQNTKKQHFFSKHFHGSGSHTGIYVMEFKKGRLTILGQRTSEIKPADKLYQIGLSKVL